jgi:hypothetical protein
MELRDGHYKPDLEWGYPMTADVSELLDAYRSTAAAWDVMQGDSSKANPLFDQLHQIYKQLRTEEQGRQGIALLMDDPVPGVRLMAAGHSLAWDQDRAIAVLETIEREGPGLYTVTAKYTLKSFREGKLNLDW